MRFEKNAHIHPCTTNSHVKTQSMVFRPLISLDRHPQKLVSVKVNQRSEGHRFDVDVSVAATLHAAWLREYAALGGLC